jgi:hypothetical protein
MRARSRILCYAFFLCGSLAAITRYVNVNNPTPAAPYTSWASAATSIQDAVDACSDGDLVRVTNGVYATGGAVTPGFHLQCRLVVTTRITVQSVNGPDGTAIVGSGPVGSSAVRCAYLTNNAVLAGFTLSNGYTRTDGYYSFDRSGAGALLYAGTVLSNCVVADNVAYGDSWRGGAVHCYWGGDVIDCRIQRNVTTNGAGGGVNCWYGGTVRASQIINNRAHTSSGGGIYCYRGGVFVDTLVSNNTAAFQGGGIWIDATGTVDRCIVACNVATNSGGGVCAHYGGLVMHSLIHGNTAFTVDQYSGGGGASIGWGAVISNCIVYGNRCTSVGGGLRVLYDGSHAFNCAVFGNYAQMRGGGADVTDAALLNCSVCNNQAGASAGGAYFSYSGMAGNTIIYHNRAPLFDNAEFINNATTNINCCIATAPLQAVTINLLTNDPVLLGVANPHIATNSPCVNAGTNALAWGVDIDNEPRIADGRVDIGCDEVWTAGLTGALTAAIYAPYTVVVVNVAAPFYADVQGKAAVLAWEIDTNGGVRSISDAGMVWQAWPEPGTFPVILRAANADGVAAATVMVQVVSAFTNYAAHGGGHVAPFTSLAQAATSISAALAAAPPGGVTVVSNGVYAEATIVLDKQGTLTSLSGRDATILDGQGLRRCVLMTHAGARLAALTLSNGFLSSDNGAGAYVAAGVIDGCALVAHSAYRGSAALLLPGAVITGSYVCGNRATYSFGRAGALYFEGGGLALGCAVANNYTTSTSGDGGGMVFNYGGTAAYCIIAGNRADDGAGAYCYYGGELLNCVITGNISAAASLSAGGGVYCDHGGVLRNCQMVENYASGRGGGVRGYYGGLLYNCTLVNNRTLGAGGGYYGSSMELNNCIVYYNRATTDPDYYHAGTVTRQYSCLTPLLSNDLACFAAPPGIAGVNNPHLLTASPCVDTGSNALAAGIAVDVDGEARIYNSVVDVGCDECVPAGLTGMLTAAILTDYTNAVLGAPLQFRANVCGKAQGLVWRIATGSGDALVSNQTTTSYAWSAPGAYQIELRAWNMTQSAAATVTVTMLAGFTNYVDGANATPVAPYTSWATAATSIVDAVSAAYAGGMTVVTTGTYRELATIMVDKPLRLLGVGGPAQVVVNGAGARRCLQTSPGCNVLISGLTFSNGVADSGAGVFCNPGDTVSNCVFVRNVAGGSGGGLYAAGAAQIMECLFRTNSAAHGGGAYLNGGTLTQCAFAHNLAGLAAGYGGGAYLNGGSLLACTLQTNLARYGGGAYAYYGSAIRDTWFVGNIATASSSTTIEGGGLNSMSTPVISNCHFTGNRAARTDCYGGGAYVRYSTLHDCSFSANHAGYGGGADLFACTATRLVAVSNMTSASIWGARGAGLRVRSSSTLRDSQAYDNSAGGGAGGGIAAHQNSIVSNCLILRNTAQEWDGGAGVFADGNALVVQCQISDNHARYSGGGARLSGGILRQCTVVSNSAGMGNGGGGVYILNGGTVDRCSIAANLTAMNGGGISQWGSGHVLSSYIAYNVATNEGGGVYLRDWTGDASVQYCTIVDNLGVQRGGGVFLNEGGYVRNCILMYNLAARDENLALDTGTFADYSCCTPVPPGPGNFATAPLLAGAGNPHLLPGSPCLDAGTNVLVGTLDIDNEPRPNGARPDVGCDELWPSGLTGTLTVAIRAPYTNVVLGVPVPFDAVVEGRPQTLLWLFQTETGADVVSNIWNAEHAWNTTGAYAVVCRVFNSDHSASATVMVSVTLPVTNYVALTGASIYPYDSWAKAATQLVDAVEATAGGGLVLVSNGVYASSQGVLIWGKPLTVRSLSGWQETILDGGGTHRAFVVLETEALIDGFTIMNGYAPDDVFSGAGAGVVLYKRGTVRNCVFLNNQALNYGGGAVCMEGGRVENCFFSGNVAQFGGGVLCFGGGTVVNCTAQRNRALAQGGGVFCQDGGVVQNSIMYYNYSAMGANFFNQNSGMVYQACCTTPHPGDTLSLTNPPQLAGLANPHLLTNSPCINAGSNSFAAGITHDIDGEPRIIGGWVDIGCDEMLDTNLFGALSAAIVATRTNSAPGFPIVFQADLRGKVLRLVWQMQMPAGPPALLTNQAEIAFAWPQTGTYQVVLSAENASMTAAATAMVSIVNAATNFVSLAGGHVPPFDSWANAATTILDAVAVAVPGNLILVTNGTYYERAEVLLDVPVTLRSENPLGATIHGRWQRRCARIDDPGAVIDGFYLYRGNPTNSPGGEGGGIVLNGGGTVMNCTIRDNKSPTYGAGALLYGGGVITNCEIDNNSYSAAYGGGAALFNGGLIVDSRLRWNQANERGGGAECYFGGTLLRCRVHQNQSGWNGGGLSFYEGGRAIQCDIVNNQANEGGGIYFHQGGAVEYSSISNNVGYSHAGGAKTWHGGCLRNSLVYNNSSPWGTFGGGGVMLRFAGLIENCTIASNSAESSGYGGLVCSEGGTISNAIVYHNQGVEILTPEESTFVNCCAPIPLAGTGNTTNDPLYLDVGAGNCRPDYLTPCLNAGLNQPWMSSATDLDGQPRIISGTVDMGCYETSYGTQPPFLHITETNTAIPYFIETASVEGTNNNHVIGSMWVSNATVGGAAAPFTPARHWHSAPVSIAYGTNMLVVFGSNFLGAVVSSATNIVRALPGPDAPFVWITTMPQNVSYDVGSMIIAGTNNANVAGGMWLSNSANGIVVTFAAAPAWAQDIALAVGANLITAYGSNAAGVVAYDVVTITRGGIGTGAPFVDITNGSPRVVGYGAASAMIGGTNNANVMGAIRWQNTTGSTSGAAARNGEAWTALITGLVHGDNTVQVVGTNLLAQTSTDTLIVHRKTATEAAPQIASNVLIFPSHAAVLHAPLPTNVIWRVEGITDDDDGTNVTISAITVHVSNTLAQAAIVTNDISNLAGICGWLVPEYLAGGGTNYVVRFEVRDSSGLTNSMVFRGNAFTVVPEAAGLLAMLSIYIVQFTMWQRRRKA